MNRMILEFPRIETLEGVTRTPYNQYESVILPLKAYLEGFGVDFSIRAVVEDLDFKEDSVTLQIFISWKMENSAPSIWRTVIYVL